MVTKLLFSQALIDENGKLRNELHRMKQEQVVLQKRANEATSDMQFMRVRLNYIHVLIV